MKNLFVALGILFCVGCISNQNEDVDKRLTDLEARVSRLEAGDSSKALRVKRMKEARPKALARMKEDSKLYSTAQLREINSLYRPANKRWGTQEAKDNLKELIAKFPKSNRAGCAVLYLGQMSEDEKEKEDYFRKAIEQYGDCCYGNGVVVGAYVRYYLACCYLKDGRKADADKLFNEIKKEYPKAIDHRGNLLVDLIKKKQSK